MGTETVTDFLNKHDHATRVFFYNTYNDSKLREIKNREQSYQKNESPQQCLIQVISRDGGSDDFITHPTLVGKITLQVNEAALLEGYTVTQDLYNLKLYADTLFLHEELSKQDLGITLLAMAFGEYYVRGQYHIFVNDYSNVNEIETFETFISECSKTYVKLPKHIAIDETFGLKANAFRFCGKNSIGWLEMQLLLSIITANSITPSLFVELLSIFHIRIIETFYAFAVLERSKKLLIECREMARKETLNYKLERFITESRYDPNNAAYWFSVPPKSVWFSWSGAQRRFYGYTSRDHDDLLDELREIKEGIIIGFVHERQLYPVMIDSPRLLGNWKQTINLFREKNLNVVQRDDRSPDKRDKNVHFVKHRLRVIFKLVKPARVA